LDYQPEHFIATSIEGKKSRRLQSKIYTCDARFRKKRNLDPRTAIDKVYEKRVIFVENCKNSVSKTEKGGRLELVLRIEVKMPAAESDGHAD